MSTYLIGLDFGGGGGRCLVLDVERRTTSVAARAWRFAAAPGTGGLGFDVDLAHCFAALADATREAVDRAGARPEEIAGIACTALRLGNVMLDAAGDVLLAVPNRDARAVGPGLMLAAEHGDALYACTGRWPYPIHTAARLQWLRAERPATYNAISHVLSLSDWIAYALCGARLTDPTQAGETLLFDLEARAWSDDLVGQLGLRGEILPEVREPGTRIGELGAEAAARLGLSAGTPVVMGGGDTQCGLLGAGALEAGDTAVVAGTTGPIQRISDAPQTDIEQRLWTGHHLRPGQWVVESNCGPLGETLDWFARLLYPEAPEPVVRLLAEAAQAPPGARGFVSSLGAEVMNARAMGLPVGHLTLSHLSSIDDPAPRPLLVRAVVEGIACALRANLEQIDAVTGASPATLRLSGGLSRSATFVGILSGVLGDEIAIAEEPGASALGAALCAGVGTGVFADLAAACDAIVRTRPAAPLEKDGAGDYAAIYPRWSRLRAARAAADAEASALTTPFAIAAQQAEEPGALASARPRILVAADCDERSLAGLRELGEVEYASFRIMGRMLTGENLVAALAGHQIFITEIDLVDAASLAALPDLRVVASCRGDAVNVDIDACTAFGIPVLNTPGRNADAVADLTIAFMLMLARKLLEAGQFLTAPGIEPGDMGVMGRAFGALQGVELWHKTIGLVGLGAVGRKVAARLAGFGARVLVADPFVDAETVSLVGATKVSLDRLLAESDFVSLHAAVTPETTGILGEAELARMKETAFLLNTARAALLDEEALTRALEEGRIAGAALDTFSVEPPGSDHPLMKLDNVLCTPHIGGNTKDVSAHQGEIVWHDLRRLLAGERPHHIRNPEVLSEFALAGPRRTPDAETLTKLEAGPAPAVTDLQKKQTKVKSG